jgi:hypothetical protein
MTSKPVESPLQSPMLGSGATLHGALYRSESSEIPLIGHSTIDLILMVWKLQLQSHVILLMHRIQSEDEPGHTSNTINARDHVRHPPTNFFTRHPEDMSTSCGQSPSAIGGLAWASWRSSGLSSDGMKRRRSGEGDNDENDWHPPKKRKIQLYSAQNKQGNVHLACHFHIYDPLRYSGRASDTKYTACEGPGWKNIIRLKYASKPYAVRRLKYLGNILSETI